MRIPSSYFQRYATQQLARTQENVAEYQQQISTGYRNNEPSDDPTAVATAEKLDAALERLEQYKENGTAVSQRLTQQEHVFNNLIDTLQRLKELSIQASSEILNTEDRRIIGSEVKQIQKQLLDYGNTKLTNGEFLFSGSKGTTQPFTMSGGEVTYHGDQSETYVKLSDSRSVRSNDTGDDIFERIRNGNGRFYSDSVATNVGSGVISGGLITDTSSFINHPYEIRFTSTSSFDVIDTSDGSNILTAQTYEEEAPIAFAGVSLSISGAPAAGDSFIVAPSKNVDIFSVAFDLSRALDMDRDTEADIARSRQVLNNSINQLDASLEHIQTRLSDLGARQGYIASTRDETGSVQAILTNTRSELKDTDMVEAISQLQFHMTTLEAIRQTYAQLGRNNLFDYLN